MIQSKKDLRFYIQEDFNSNLNGKKKSFVEYHIKKIIGHEGVMACEYLKCLRKLEYFINCRKDFFGNIYKVLYKVKLQRLSLRLGIQISPNTCGYGLRLLHFKIGGGIIINCISMGNYCSVNAGVVVGNKDYQKNRPTIGNNVKLNVGCKVIGKITIGNNVIVAPNSVVVKDVPNNAIVSGIPSTILKIKE